MAQKLGRQGPWPRIGRNEPEAHFQTQDVIQRYERSVAGPLRLGTAPGVGPRGPSVANGRREEGSDLGMDRVSPREFDPLGTTLTRYGPNPQSGLVAQTKRGGERRE
jgi:hypothetical protein